MKVLLAIGLVIAIALLWLKLATAPLYALYDASDCHAAYARSRTLGDSARLDLHPFKGSDGASKHTCGEVRARRPLAAVAITSLLASAASAQSASQQAAATTPVGVWRGTSVCLVRPSPCNDEIVVYRITHMKAADSLAVDARKTVHGAEQEMGVLTCRLNPPTGLTCTMPQGIWRFSVRSDSLIGELRLPDNTRYRDVRAIRAR